MNKDVIYIKSQLQDYIPEAELSEVAFWILEEVSGYSKTDILLGKTLDNYSEIDAIIARLKKHEPIQYIFGHTYWRGMKLAVNSATLIPRPETSEIIDYLCSKIADKLPIKSDSPISVLDIGTGSGCIAIGLKKEFPNWQIDALDISQEALKIAKQNAVDNEAEINFFQADILNWKPTKKYDIVVSNPPYICENEKAEMRENVLNFEPHSALFVSNENPLLFYRKIAELHIGKYLLCEINEHYGQETKTLLENLQYTDIQIITDIYGKERFIFGQSL